MHHPSPALLWTVRYLAAISLVLWTAVLCRLAGFILLPALRTPRERAWLKQSAFVALMMSLVTALLMLAGPVSPEAIFFCVMS